MSAAGKGHGHFGHDGDAPRISRGATEAFGALKRRAELAERKLAEAQERARGAERRADERVREADRRAAAAEATAVEGLFEVRAALARMETLISNRQSPTVSKQALNAPTTVNAPSRTGICYGVKAIAAHLGMPRRQTQYFVEKGRLPTFRQGKIVCAARAGLDQMGGRAGGCGHTRQRRRNMIALSDLPFLVVGGIVGQILFAGARRALRPRPAPPRDLYHPGDVIVVRVLLTIPRTATRADVSDWLNLMVAGIGSMSSDNALHDCEIEAHALAWSDAEPERASCHAL